MLSGATNLDELAAGEPAGHADATGSGARSPRTCPSSDGGRVRARDAATAARPGCAAESARPPASTRRWTGRPSRSSARRLGRRSRAAAAARGRGGRRRAAGRPAQLLEPRELPALRLPLLPRARGCGCSGRWPSSPTPRASRVPEALSGLRARLRGARAARALDFAPPGGCPSAEEVGERLEAHGAQLSSAADVEDIRDLVERFVGSALRARLARGAPRSAASCRSRSRSRPHGAAGAACWSTAWWTCTRRARERTCSSSTTRATRSRRATRRRYATRSTARSGSSTRLPRCAPGRRRVEVVHLLPRAPGRAGDRRMFRPRTCRGWSASCSSWRRRGRGPLRAHGRTPSRSVRHLPRPRGALQLGREPHARRAEAAGLRSTLDCP